MNQEQLVIFQKVIQKTENEQIAVRPICEYFEINYDNQLKHIKKDVILSQLYTQSRQLGSDGRSWDMISLPKDGVARWLNTINASLVTELHRNNFIDFLMALHEFLYKPKKTDNMAAEKLDQLMQIQEAIDLKDETISLMKKEITELKSEKAKLKKQYNDVFKADPNQIKIPFPNPQPSAAWIKRLPTGRRLI